VCRLFLAAGMLKEDGLLKQLTKGILEHASQR
jgi:hypothetical protein